MFPLCPLILTHSFVLSLAQPAWSRDVTAKPTNVTQIDLQRCERTYEPAHSVGYKYKKLDGALQKIFDFKNRFWWVEALV